MNPEPSPLEIFRMFMTADTLANLQSSYSKILEKLNLQPASFENFYPVLKSSLNGHDTNIKLFFDELDEKTSNKVYFNLSNERDCLKGQNCLIIGGTACSLRTAIELQLLGADRVVIVDTRNKFKSKYFVHLWSYVIQDLKLLGGKRLCQYLDSQLDHIQTKRLELLLLKVVLTLGCEFFSSVEFEEICPLSLLKESDTKECFCNLHLNNDQINSKGAYAHFKYNTKDFSLINKLNTYAFNIIICGTERVTFFNRLFGRKELKDKPSIVIKCSFLNSKTLTGVIPASSLCYVDRKDHPHLFNILKEVTGADLDNYCMYRDEIISFVLKPTKRSLLNKGVLIEDKLAEKDLVHPKNVNKAELFKYVTTCCNFLTGLTEVVFTTNSKGDPDCTIYDFSVLSSSRNACCIKDILLRSKCCRKSPLKKDLILVGLVGEALQSPAWSLLGSTIGRGFFSAMDYAWMCKQFGEKVLKQPRESMESIESSLLEVIGERESIFELLQATTTETIQKNFKLYTIDPSNRYLNYKSLPFKAEAYKHLLFANLLN